MGTRLELIVSFLDHTRTPGGITLQSYHDEFRPHLVEWKAYDEVLLDNPLPQASWEYKQPFTGESKRIDGTIYSVGSTDLMAIASDTQI